MQAFDALQSYVSLYTLALIATVLLGLIAYYVERMRKSLRSIHFIMATEFAERHELGRIEMKDIP